MSAGISKTAKVKFSAGRVQNFKCPPAKAQAFLWDLDTKGLGLRATPPGKPSYVFQAVYQGKDIRLTIGSPDDWTIPLAQEKARQLQRMIDEGKDPRDLKRDALAQGEARAAQKAIQVQQETMQAIPVRVAWGEYMADRKTHWGERHYQDQIKMIHAGGDTYKRGTGITIPGALHALMDIPLIDVTLDRVNEWAAKEKQTRPSQARGALRCLKAFLTWCNDQPQYAPLLLGANVAKSRKARETLGTALQKKDSLQKEQLQAWFTAVQQIGNPVISAYLQILLLTGARPGEIMTMQWPDVNIQWKGINIRDKVEGEREIPLTPYVHFLLSVLPRRNKWVFSSNECPNGHISRPSNPFTRACKAAGMECLTLHGLRRSFKSLTEWLEVPVGVVAQIQGHKPSATAEKHYTVRPLDLLRVHHEKIEAWILEQAGIKFDANNQMRKLRVISSN